MARGLTAAGTGCPSSKTAAYKAIGAPPVLNTALTIDELEAQLLAARDTHDVEAYSALIPQFKAAGRSDVAALMTAVLEGNSL
jgi:hypothetical protein